MGGWWHDGESGDIGGKSVPKLMPLRGFPPLLSRVLFVPQTANTNWNYSEKSAVKPTRHAAPAETNWVLSFKKRGENSVKMQIMRGQRTPESLPPPQLLSQISYQLNALGYDIATVWRKLVLRLRTRTRNKTRITNADMWVVQKSIHFNNSYISD